MVIAPFPHRYTVHIDAEGALHAPPRAPVAVGAPAQFGGSDKVWSPEELLVAATLTCLKTTFDAYAKRAALDVASFVGTGTGILEKGRRGPEIRVIELAVELVVEAGQEDRAKDVLLRAERDCIIARALKAQVVLTFGVTAAPMRAASLDEHVSS